MVNKEPINLDVYQDFDSIFPLEYFELSISNTHDGSWRLYYVAGGQEEVTYGPYSPAQLIASIAASPFYLEPIVFVYYLVEHDHPELRDLGISLLKLMAQT